MGKCLTLWAADQNVEIKSQAAMMRKSLNAHVFSWNLPQL